MIKVGTSHPAFRSTQGATRQQQREMDVLARGYECVGDTAFLLDIDTWTIVRRSTKPLYKGESDGGKTKVYYTRDGRDHGAAQKRRVMGKSRYHIQVNAQNVAKAG